MEAGKLQTHAHTHTNTHEYTHTNTREYTHTHNDKLQKCQNHKVLMLEGSLDTICSSPPFLTFNEEKLRPRQGKEFGLGHTASRTVAGREGESWLC